MQRFGDHLKAGCHGKLRFLILYGSESKNSDTDYLAVYDELLRSQSLTVGGLDLWAISETELQGYIQLLDPFVTEPLLTGRIVSGCNDTFERYRSRLSQTKVSAHAIRYLLSRSFESYITACDRLTKRNHKENMLRRDYFSILSFSISYWCYSRVYSLGYQEPVTMAFAIENAPEEVKSLWKSVQDGKSNFTKRSPDLLHAWSKLLLWH